jgi:anti-anti-sigma factor
MSGTVEGLAVSVCRSEGVVTVEMDGELDRSTGDRLCVAVAMARRMARHTVVVDTAGLDFVDVSGYRSLVAACRDPLTGPHPTLVLVKGTAVRRLERLLTRCDREHQGQPQPATTAHAA